MSTPADVTAEAIRLSPSLDPDFLAGFIEGALCDSEHADTAAELVAGLVEAHGDKVAEPSRFLYCLEHKGVWDAELVRGRPGRRCTYFGPELCVLRPLYLLPETPETTP